MAADFRRVTPDPDAALSEAETLLTSRDALGAAIRVGAVLATAPDHGPALLLMARAQLALSHPETAVTAAERACALDPASGAAAGVRSEALTALGRHREAVESAERAVRAEPRLAARYDGLAGALLGAQRFAEAEEAVRTAELLEPGGPDRQLVLASAQAGLGRRDRARRTLLAVLETDPRHAGARRLLTGLRPPPPRAARRTAGDRAMRVPALALALIGAVLLLIGVPAGGVTCLVLAVVLLLGGFPGNRSEPG